MNENQGGLIVQVTAANEAQPISGATIIVSKNTESGENVIRIMKTDRNGKTEKLMLDAPPKSNSQKPGGTNLYNNYNIRVDYPGYYTAEYLDVPIFADNTAIQQIALLPLPDDEERGKKITVVESEPNL